LTDAQPPSIRRRKVEIEEVDDVDKHHPSGLKISDPVLLGPDEESKVTKMMIWKRESSRNSLRNNSPRELTSNPLSSTLLFLQCYHWNKLMLSLQYVKTWLEKPRQRALCSRETFYVSMRSGNDLVRTSSIEYLTDYLPLGR
jgi:hypothetical protein